MMNQQKAGSPRDGGGDDRVIFVTHESTYQQFAFDVPDEQGSEFVPVFSSACVPVKRASRIPSCPATESSARKDAR